MAIKVARGQITIIDQNDAVSLQAFIGSSQPLTQVFNKDTGVYAPSWAASPFLVLTPSLFVSGKAATDQISSVGNAATLTAGVKSGSAKWYKNGSAITSGQDSCTVGAASAKYALTIKANHMTVSTPQVRYAFEAVYIDANGLEVPFRSEIQFTQHLNAGAMIAAVAYAPDGVVFKMTRYPHSRRIATCGVVPPSIPPMSPMPGESRIPPFLPIPHWLPPLLPVRPPSQWPPPITWKPAERLQ